MPSGCPRSVTSVPGAAPGLPGAAGSPLFVLTEQRTVATRGSAGPGSGGRGRERPTGLPAVSWVITPVVGFCLPQDLPASVFSTRARGRLETGRARAMGLRASDPAGHHGWGGRWRRCGRRPGFRGGPPISGPRRRSRFGGSSFHRRCLPAYRMWVLNLRRNALSGLQNGRRGPSGRFSGEKGAGLPETRENRRSDALLRSRTGEDVPPTKCQLQAGNAPKIRLSSSENAQNQVGVDPTAAPPCAHRGRSHEARRPWPMRAGWPYIDRQPKLSNGPCASSRLMVVVSRGIPIPLPRSWKTDSASSFQQTIRTGQPSPRSAEP